MKILVTGLHLESNTFSTHHTEYHDFAIYEDLSHLPLEVINFSQEIGIELVPGFYASSIPGGTLSLNVYNAFQGRIFEVVRKNKNFDAILLLLHGATVIVDFSSAEERLIKSLRQFIGPSRPIAAVFDLHGNVRQECFEGLSYATALRTAPHTDTTTTLIRALKELTYICRGSTKTSIICARLPLVVPGEAFMTSCEPASSLYQLLEKDSIETSGYSNSIFCGFAWADSIHTGVSVISCSTRGTAAAREKAQDLRKRIWQSRSEFELASPLVSFESAFSQVDQATETVFLSDTGDNLTAGAGGNRVDVFNYVLQNNLKDGLFAQFSDRDLVTLANSLGVSAELPLQRLKIHDQLATVKALYKVFDTQFAILECMGNTLIVSECRFPCVENAHFEALNIDLSSYAFCVFKLGYLYPDLARRNYESILLDSSGASTLDVSKIPYRNIRGSWYPKDKKRTLEN